MEIALVILVVALIAVGALWIRQILVTRDQAARALSDCEGLRKQVAQKEADAHKSAEAKRQAIEELRSAKDEIKELKKRRHEERDAARFKRDLEQAKEGIEREMSAKLAKAQEAAAEAQGEVRNLKREVQSLQEKLAVAHQAAAMAAPAALPVLPAEDSRTSAVGDLSAEDKAKIERLAKVEASLELTKKSLAQAQEALQVAKRDLDKTRRERDQFADQLKKAKGRADLDRRLFLVQKGELEVSKDRFRTLEARHNALLLEREDLARSLLRLERELKALRPIGESAAGTVAPEVSAAGAADEGAAVSEVAVAPAAKAEADAPPAASTKAPAASSGEG